MKKHYPVLEIDAFHAFDAFALATTSCPPFIPGMVAVPKSAVP